VEDLALETYYILYYTIVHIMYVRQVREERKEKHQPGKGQGGAGHFKTVEGCRARTRTYSTPHVTSSSADFANESNRSRIEETNSKFCVWLAFDKKPVH
jgi:hypothetical protein